MSDLTNLYHEVIVDHGKNPRNFGTLDQALSLQGFNPLCGDQLRLYLKITDGKITEAKFSGQGCAISVASASLMTQSVKGKTVEEAEALFKAFHSLIMQEQSAVTGIEGVLGKLMVLQGVSAYPSRIKCATLAWHTLNGILAGKTEAVSTEK